MREPQSYYIGLLEMLQGKAGILLCIFCDTEKLWLYIKKQKINELIRRMRFQHNAQLQAYVLYIIYEK